MNREQAKKILLSNTQNSYLEKIEENRVQRLIEQFQHWAPSLKEVSHDEAQTLSADVLPLIDFIIFRIDKEQKDYTRFKTEYGNFEKKFITAIDDLQRQIYILDFAKILGASAKDLVKDEKALQRWFDHSAIEYRYVKRLHQIEQTLMFLLNRLGTVCAQIFAELNHDLKNISQLWRRIDLEVVTAPLLTFEGDQRVRIAAFDCIANSVMSLPIMVAEQLFSGNTLQFVFRSALDSYRNVWLQISAMTLLQKISPNYFLQAVAKRLAPSRAKDDFFVRRRCIMLLAQVTQRHRVPDALFTRVLSDPSAYVRQTLAIHLTHLSDAIRHEILEQLILSDKSPQVRGAALRAICQYLRDQTMININLMLLVRSLSQEQDSFVLRVALHTSVQSLQMLSSSENSQLMMPWLDKIIPLVDKLHGQCPDLAVRHFAAETLEKIWLLVDDQAQSLVPHLQKILHNMEQGESEVVKGGVPDNISDNTVGRVLSVLTQRDFGIDLSRKKRVCEYSKGHLFGFKFWRLLHELRSPAPDKRQGFSHTVARLFHGQIRAPSGILSEQGETKIPGEPVFIDAEQTWRPFLPLLDDVLAALNRKAPSIIYSSEGQTKIIVPRFSIFRLTAKIRISTHFAKIAQLRNWQNSHQLTPDSYCKTLARYGVKIEFAPWQQLGTFPLSTNESVTRFFPATFAVPFGDFMANGKDYFSSLYENTVYELSIFLFAFAGFFAGQHWLQNRKLRKLRRQIPLVIGGWGTRGKSGTERLKAALFSALGYNVLAKTTGCEAMFLHGHALGPLKEMFLYRPYDKATIWEQYEVTTLAAKLKTEVLLWECMALTPAFIKIVQRDWIRDDISTITNTYPDHESLQGPAGINIPEVMTDFIPEQAVLLTSEEQMFPILNQGAARVGTRVEQVGWLEAGLLTSDVLSRFPYEEHPYNIALVLALAKELNIDEDFALKEMADQVVPDIGVLREFAPAPIRLRQLSFVNGMSANERLGCVMNWQRMGFATQNDKQNFSEMISVVINNRSDRVVRSRVFADVIINDLHADHYYLIGTNLKGMQGYLHQAWKQFVAEITLWPDYWETQENPSALVVLQHFANRFRIIQSEDIVYARLQHMLLAVNVEIDQAEFNVCLTNPPQLKTLLKDRVEENVLEEVDNFFQRDLGQLNSYTAFEQRLMEEKDSLDDRDALDRAFHRLLWLWLKQRISVLKDPNATGNQVIEYIHNHTPPGMHNRIMGVQNIKGTGLDFVYRWFDWDKVFHACNLIRDGDTESATQGLRLLSNIPRFNLLDETYLHETLDQARHSPKLQRERVQAEISILLSRLEQSKIETQMELNTRSHTGNIAKISNKIEGFFDAADAIKRKKTTQIIYKDLANERISHERAAKELRLINQRQKGGWLAERVYHFFKATPE